MKMRISIICFIFILFLLAGCVSQQDPAPVTAPSSTPQIQLEVMPRYVLESDEVAPDVQAVLTSLLKQLWGDDEPIRDVRFDPSGDNQIRPVPFLKDTFTLQIVDISGLQTRKVSESQADAFIEGFFQFKDVIGRMVSFYFVATYSHTPEGLTIHSSSAMPLPSLFPVVETYFVPRSAFDGADLSEFSGFSDLYLFSIINAVPMVPTQEEKEALESHKATSFTGRLTGKDDGQREDYYILTFCMNWMAPESALEMVVSKEPGAGGKSLAQPVYLAWKNWRVIAAGGTFNPCARQDLFYANVFYNIDPESGDPPLLIGTFANQKTVMPPRPGSMEISVVNRAEIAAAREPEPVAPGPLASGAVFLDPTSRPDAARIQQRLADLGYYTMTVDGAFGRGSRTALMKFKTESGLESNGNWDLATQKLLFRDSGL